MQICCFYSIANDFPFYPRNFNDTVKNQFDFLKLKDIELNHKKTVLTAVEALVIHIIFNSNS